MMVWWTMVDSTLYTMFIPGIQNSFWVIQYCTMLSWQAVGGGCPSAVVKVDTEIYGVPVPDLESHV